MGRITFFSSWELWQQMTFVLAAAIVVVFIAGLVKLWWLSRFLRKHTILDEEKRTRQQEMRKSGIPSGRRVDIPFGVRAIQSGVQIDGIWISRPGTPVETLSPGAASSTTLEPDSEVREKREARRPNATVAEVQPTPRQSPAASFFERNSSTDVSDTEAGAPKNLRTVPQPAFRPGNSSQRLSSSPSHEIRNIDGLSRLQGRTAKPRPHIVTYVPTKSIPKVHPSASSHRQPSAEPVPSSSEEADSTPPQRHGIQATSGPLAHPPLPPRSFEGQQVPAPAHVELLSWEEHFSILPTRRERERMNNRETRRGSHDESGHSHYPPPLAASRPVPHRSYTVEIHANTTTRNVNEGFEVLAAGVSSRSSSEIDLESGQTCPKYSPASRFYKKRRHQPSGQDL
ncbi:hypothetical protein F4778DRAFT_340388 [Xylariomycetidae sp. FL2044]|nr:hypothetical protein F4778DRAFT_340388 [Xylariomycetidae sp. FL2044]